MRKPFVSTWIMLLLTSLLSFFVLFNAISCAPAGNDDDDSAAEEELALQQQQEAEEAAAQQVIAQQAHQQAVAAQQAAHAAAVLQHQRAHAAAVAAANRSNSSSSNGGGGGGSSFSDPTSLTNLALWLDANDAATILEATADTAEDGDRVRFWNDKSGNVNHASGHSSTSTLRPTYDDDGMGGKPALMFADDYLDLTAKAINTNLGDFTFFVVFKSSSTTSNQRIYWERASAGYGFTLSHHYSNTYRALSYIGNSTNGNTSAAASNPVTYTDGNPHIMTVRMSDHRYHYTWKNGTSDDEIDDSFTDEGATSAIGVIGRAGSSASGYFDGSISEIIIYTSALSDANREEVECYLGSKWTITVPHSC